MKISLTCDLFLKDLYFYDIKSAFYQIAKINNYEFKDINVDNKTERNIQIGKEQINNPVLSEFLRKAAKNTIDSYLIENEIYPEEIISTQMDGCILTRMLKDNKKFLELSLRDHIDFMIITPDRKKFITVVNDIVDVKGVSNKYDQMQTIFNKFKNLNFYNKKSLFKQFENIKRSIVDSEDKNLFIINKNDKNLIITKKHGLIEIKKGLTFSIKGIDRQRYYDLYIKEFMDSLFLHFY